MQSKRANKYGGKKWYCFREECSKREATADKCGSNRVYFCHATLWTSWVQLNTTMHLISGLLYHSTVSCLRQAWLTTSSRMTVGQLIMTSQICQRINCHPDSRYVEWYSQLTSAIKSGSRLHWSILTKWKTPGFELPRQQWSLLIHFHSAQRHCGICMKNWQQTDTDLCPCEQTQTMSQIVDCCPLTKLNGSLLWLYCADNDTVAWLTCVAIHQAKERKMKKLRATQPVICEGNITVTLAWIPVKTDHLYNTQNTYTELITVGLQLTRKYSFQYIADNFLMCVEWWTLKFVL